MRFKGHTLLLIAAAVAGLTGCQVREAPTRSENGAAPAAGNQAAPAAPALSPGSVTLIEVSLAAHAPSQAAQAETAAIAREFGPRGLKVVGWVVGAASAKLPEAGYPLQAVTAEQLAPLGTVRVMPSRVLVDRAGRVRQVYPGVAWPAAARAEIEAVLAEAGT